MIRMVFRYADGAMRGFSLRGHAGAGAAGEDIVCAAVSSAAYMTANTLTDVCGAAAAVTVEEGEMTLSLAADTACTQTVLAGFFLHMSALQQQYPTRIQIQKTEV